MKRIIADVTIGQLDALIKEGRLLVGLLTASTDLEVVCVRDALGRARSVDTVEIARADHNLVNVVVQVAS